MPYKDPAKRLECQRKWNRKNYARIKASNNAWAHANKEKRRASIRKYRGQIDAPSRPRPELCEAGCGRPATSEDHDHVTGKFRWWLCKRCNLALAGFGDSLEGVEKALAALRRHA